MHVHKSAETPLRSILRSIDQPICDLLHWVPIATSPLLGLPLSPLLLSLPSTFLWLCAVDIPCISKEMFVNTPVYELDCAAWPQDITRYGRDESSSTNERTARKATDPEAELSNQN